MKVGITGGLIIGSKDINNLEIAEELQAENMFLFGTDLDKINEIQEDLLNNISEEGQELLNGVYEVILNGFFGDYEFIKDYVFNVRNGVDHHLISHDFYSYANTQDKIEFYTETRMNGRISVLLVFSDQRFSRVI